MLPNPMEAFRSMQKRRLTRENLPHIAREMKYETFNKKLST